ncbi:MAG: hypothetical protein K2Q18_19385, partial [Bdellovibrionales bacterium]|nr:hypothetical protein [Bdellovibrionales bacterium]
MIFSTPSFIFFTFFLLIVYYFWPVNKRELFFVFATTTWYSFSSAKWVLEIYSYSLVNYLFFIFLTRSKSHKKLLLTISILLNVSFLIVSKTMGQFPGGLSFFVLICISLLIAGYKQSITNISWTRFFNTVFFFPALVSGPVENPKRLGKYFSELSSLQKDNLIAGGSLLFYG